VVLADWKLRTLRALTGHYNSARRFEKWSRILTVLSLSISLLAAVLTAAVLAATHPTTSLRLAAVLAAALASALGLLQSQLNLGQRATQHLSSGAGYSKIRRMLEVLDEADPNILNSTDFRHIERLYSEVSQSAPIIPKAEWDAAHAKYPKTLESGTRAPNCLTTQIQPPSAQPSASDSTTHPHSQ
jgi:hypothetical protein